MNFGQADRFRALQKQYSDPLLTLLTILLLMFVVAPLQAAGIMAFQAFGLFVALAMICGIIENVARFLVFAISVPFIVLGIGLICIWVILGFQKPIAPKS